MKTEQDYREMADGPPYSPQDFRGHRLVYKESPWQATLLDIIYDVVDLDEYRPESFDGRGHTTSLRLVAPLSFGSRFHEAMQTSPLVLTATSYLPSNATDAEGRVDATTIEAEARVALDIERDEDGSYSGVCPRCNSHRGGLGVGHPPVCQSCAANLSDGPIYRPSGGN